MPTFGEVLIGMLKTIISSIMDTAVNLGKGLITLFQIVASNAGRIPPLTLFLAAAIFAVVIFFLFKMFRAESKQLIIAIFILITLVVVALSLLR